MRTYVPAAPGHFVVSCWLPGDKIVHRLTPIIAWRITGETEDSHGVADAVTMNPHLNDSDFHAILYPDGRVTSRQRASGDQWESLHDYLREREPILRDILRYLQEEEDEAA